MASKTGWLTRFPTSVTAASTNHYVTTMTGSHMNISNHIGSSSIMVTSSYSNVLSNGGMIYAPYVPLQTQNLNTTYIDKYTIPAGSVVYVESNLHTTEYVHEALKLKSIEHIYNDKSKSIIMAIDNECTFDEVDIISTVRPTITASLGAPSQNTMIKFKLPKPYLGITAISTFEFKHTREEVIKK